MMTTSNRLNVENLEDRICLDGSISVDIDQLPGYGGLTAFIQGDSLANSLQITQTAKKDFTISGKGFGEFDTAINGANQIHITNISNFLIDMKGGDDFVFVNGDSAHSAPREVSIDGFFKFFGKGGDDNVLFENSKIRGDFYAELGGGNNFLQWIDSRLIGKTHVSGAGGNDFVGGFRSVFQSDVEIGLAGGRDAVWFGSAENELAGSRIIRSLNMNLGHGDDVVKIDESVVKGDTKIKLGHGNDQISSKNSRFNTMYDIRVWTGNGDDSVELEDVNMTSDSTIIRTGNGADRFSALRLRDSGIGTDSGYFSFYGGRQNDRFEVQSSRLFRHVEVNGNLGNDDIFFSGVTFGHTTNHLMEAHRVGGGMGGGMGGGSISVNGGGGAADFTSLIDLIVNTVEPDSWEDIGNVEEYNVQNLSLIITQTPSVHKKIADLLEQLRQLQNLQVTVEVKFISLQDSFFERIGVDFDFDVNDNSGVVKLNNVSNRTNPFDIDMTVGLDDIRFTVNSLDRAPKFGGFDASTAANFGFAILSDIEVFFLIQASKGNELTMRNPGKIQVK